MQRTAYELTQGDRIAITGGGPATVTGTVHHEDRTVTVRATFEDGSSYSRQVMGTAPYRMQTACEHEGCNADVTQWLHDTCAAHDPDRLETVEVGR